MEATEYKSIVFQCRVSVALSYLAFLCLQYKK